MVGFCGDKIRITTQKTDLFDRHLKKILSKELQSLIYCVHVRHQEI